MEYTQFLIKYLGLLIFSLLFAIKSYAQDVHHIALKPVPCSKTFRQNLKPTKVDGFIKVKKVPLQVLDYLIKYTDFSYKNEKHKIITSNRIYFLIGKNKSGDIIVIPDLNNDFDFTNDKVMTYKALKTEANMDSLPYIKVPIKVENICSTYILQPYPYPTAFKYSSQSEQNNYLMIKSFQQQEGEFYLGDKKYKILVHNIKPSPFFDDTDFIEIAFPTLDSVKVYRYNEIINIGDKKFMATQITPDGSQLSLRQLDITQNNFGYTKGLKLFQINTLDIYNKKISFPAKGKYTLIDFWGTWCSPCLALTGELKRINKIYMNKLNVVSIAYDSDINQVKKYILSNKLLWTHIFQSDKVKTNGLINQFGIDQYPTFILTDEKGEIIVRSSGEDGLKEIESILKSIQ